MAGILFSVFSGHASGIFDNFLYSVHEKYIDKKSGADIFVPQVYSIETQWDDGGNTGYILEFNLWLEQKDEFFEIIGGDFILPPPMGDLKAQIARWSKYLIKEDLGKTVATTIANRQENLEDAVFELRSLLEILRRLSPDIFLVEDKIHFLDIFIKFYTEFHSQSGLKIKHSVGNLFLNFFYYYSYLIVDSIETIYEHHHQAFFNFLKDLSLVPRGNRIEFLIDGRYNVSGISEDSILIPSERFFDDYPSEHPVRLDTYNIKVIDGSDFENKFQKLFANCDFVVIPPGSLSNWMPIINKFHRLLKTKPLLWFVNSFTHYSEAPLEQQISYVVSLGIDPIILAPKLDNPFDELNRDERVGYEKSYFDQGKTAVNFKETFRKFNNSKILRDIPLKELEPGEGGIKYSPDFVEFFLLKIAEKIDGIELDNELFFEKAEEAAKEFDLNY